MKYRLTDDTIKILGTTLYRIQAVRSFGNVIEGEFGGYIEYEMNLSQDGNSWVYGNAKVCGDAKVYGNAEVYGYAKVCGDAEVCDNAEVYGNAKVCGDAKVYGNAEVYGNSWVCDNAEVYGDAKVYGNAEVYGNAKVYGNAEVYGNSWVCDNAEVCGDADYIVFKNWWSSGRFFTWTRSNNMWRVGCFFGTGEELIKKAYADSELSGREYKRVVDYVESILADEK